MMKKFISVFTAITTTLWLVGGLFVIPVHGATLVDGDVAREADEFDVYIIKIVGTEKFKRLILNPDVFNMYGHLKWENVKVVADGELAAYTTSDLVREINDEKVYKLYPNGDTGTKKWVESLDCFNSKGYNWNSVYIINSFDRDSYTTSATTLCGGEVVEGAITLSLASDTPAAASLPYNAQSVELLKVKVAGSGTISQMVFKRSGLGDASDFNNVYLYEGDKRLTSGRSISSSTNKVTFIGLSITAPTTITLVGDLANDANDNGHINTFSVEAASDVTSSATVGGSFPIAGNPMSITSIQGGTLTIAKSGSLSNPTVGQSQAQISQFQITGANEPIDIYRVALYNGGTMDSTGITNLKLKDAAGTVVAKADACGSNDICTLVFDSAYRLAKGDSKIFKLYADLSGRKDDTIKLYFEVSADVRGVGATYGAGTSVNISAMDSADESHSLTLKGGELTISNNNPVAAYVADDTNDTVFLNLAFTAAADLEIRKMKVYFCFYDEGSAADATTNIKAEIEDIKVKDKDTGTILMGPTDGSGFTVEGTAAGVCSNNKKGIYKEWTDMWDLSAGKTKNIQVTGDIAADTYTDADDGWKAVLRGYANLTNAVKYSGTNTYVAAADIVPSTDIAGNLMTIQVSSINVALASVPTSFVDGTKSQTGVTAMGLVFTAGEASEMTVTNLVLTGYVGDAEGTYTIGKTADGLYAKNVVTNVTLYEDDGTTVISGPKSFSGGTDDSDVTFDSLSWNVPAGATKKMLVKVDITTTATSGTYDYVAFDITDKTDITAIDNKGNSRNSSSEDINGTVTSNPSVLVRKSDGGTLAVAAAPAGIRPETTYVYQGQTSAEFSKFKFTSTIEAFKIKKMTIELDDDTAISDGGNMTKVELSYPIDAAGTLVNPRPSGYFAGTASVSFDLTGKEMYVPKDGYAYVTVYADLSTYAEVGNQSGDSWSLDFEGDVTTAFEATGVGSSKKIQADDSNIADQSGQAMYLYRTFPSFTLDGPAGSSGPTMPTTILKFTVTNHGDYDLVFNSTSGELKFAVLGSGSETGNAEFTLYKSDKTKVDAVTVTTPGLGTAFATFDFTDAAVIIPKNGSQAFYIDITSGKSVWDENGDYLQLKLQDADNVVKWDDGGSTTQVGLKAGIKNIGIPIIGPEFSISGL